MAGYAIQARIDGVRPRLSSPATRGVDVGDWPVLESDQRMGDPALVADEGQLASADRWERQREVWSQTTFFLFDPNSWR